jgi:WD40 repeat protein
MVWDETSVISASADRTIRYWDLVAAESEGEYYSGIIMRGHLAGVTQLKRLNNSFNRVVSAGMDGTVRIWDVNSGICTGEFGDHDSIGISRLAMNPKFLISYSDQNNTMIVRDFEKGN